MNWKSIKHLSDDDYGKPILLRIDDKDYDEQRYVAVFVSRCRDVYAIGYFNDTRITIMSDLKLTDDMRFVRCDEITL